LTSTRGRLVDVLPARSAVTEWLSAKPTPWLAGIRRVVIDPYHPYATAVAKGVPVARVVVDHFHVIRLANAALDDVRHRTQNDTLGYGGPQERPAPT
jgi:transposase